MKYVFFVKTDRVNSIFLELPGKSQIIEQDDEMTKVEVTIESGLDALALFHAGIRVGMDTVLIN
tara:strand:+ start:723 stop:914 length:192 start_codon:yes stop_codon:yes gene_type:complete